MEANIFKEKWLSVKGDEVSPLSLSAIEELPLKPDTKSFLAVCGLPVAASPFLTFVIDTDDVYSRIDYLPNQYDHLGKEFGEFVVIGSDGEANPIVIDTASNDMIMWLDHEDSFNKRYMNSSISKLAEFLLAYRDFNEMLLKENGEDAVIDSNFSDYQLKTLKDRWMKIDAEALKEGSYWITEIETLVSNRSANR